ncbi:MAG: Amt family ammonium transporter, partial [Myxococcota bacterium]
MLVFFMHAGFALLESGFSRQKNTVNILAKNFLVVALASLAFFFLGFGFMFGEGDFIGLTGFIPAFDGTDVVGTPANLPVAGFFFFQLVFAATAATIVSGAVAERIKLGAFMAFAFVLVLVIYPVVGHWTWGGGFLSQDGFHDFAGSTVVHSVGGWAALTGAYFLGPRLGRYGKNGKPRAIPGHSMPLAAAGAFILWLGWFGFNAGSQLDASGGAIASIAVVTNMAAAAGALGACLVAFLKLRSPDFSMIVNGALAGLVAITAGCDIISPVGAIIVGGLAGGLVVFAVLTFDRIRIDDPVGAISVHLVCGIFGTLMVGFFATDGGLFYGGGAELLLAQLTGVGIVGVFTLGSSSAVWLALKHTVGIRVSEEDERIGLDISEMKMEAYPADSTAGGGSSVM